MPGGLGAESMRILTFLWIRKSYLTDLVRHDFGGSRSTKWKQLKKRIRDHVMTRGYRNFMAANVASIFANQDLFFHLLDDTYQDCKTSGKALKFSKEEEHNTLAQLSHMDVWSDDLILAILLPSVLKVETLAHSIK